MGRYVILRHECPPEFKPSVHWDLMLEAGNALRTWALAVEPAPGISIAADQLPDHRLEYLDYEGPVSGNRGTVIRWDTGWFELLSESTAELTVRLMGNRLVGKARIARTVDKSAPWEFRVVELSLQKPSME